MNACPPLLDVGRFTGTSENTCRSLNNAVLNKLKTENYDKMILAARWPLYYTGTRSKNEPGPNILIKGTNQFKNKTGSELIEQSIKYTIQILNNLNQEVYVFGSVAEVPWHVPENNLNRNFFGRSSITTFSDTIPLERSTKVDKILKETSEKENAFFIPISPLLCHDNNLCKISENGNLLYRDGDHMSSYGAMFLYEKTFGRIPVQK